MAKKIKRMQLSVDEQMERAVKFVSDMEERPYEYQLRWLKAAG